MASGTALLGAKPIHMLITGFPGAGKTGAIAALLNVGYKVRVIDFEGNYEPLLAYADPRTLKHPNLDILTFADLLAYSTGDGVMPVGIPDAFEKAMKSIVEWKTTNDNGEPVSLGSSREWGPDTIVVVDSATGLGEAAFRRARKMMNKTKANTTQAVWGAAVDDQIGFIKVLHHPSHRHHTITLAHLQMIGPKLPGDKEDDLAKEVKNAAAELIPTRLWPKAVTQAASQTFHKEFPIMVKAERKTKQGKVVRVLQTTSGEETDTKFPAKIFQLEYPIDTGLATMFELLGAKAPGLKP